MRRKSGWEREREGEGERENFNPSLMVSLPTFRLHERRRKTIHYSTAKTNGEARIR